MLTEIGQGLSYAEGEVRFYGARLMTRMSVVALPGGGCAVISPLLPSPSLLGALRALGPVRHLISPNKIHNQGLPGMAATFPGAQIWASPGLPERLPGLVYAGTLGDAPHPDWAPVLDQHLTRGNLFFSEVAFFHRASRTLILADLVENVTKTTMSGGLPGQLRGPGASWVGRCRRPNSACIPMTPRPRRREWRPLPHGRLNAF